MTDLQLEIMRLGADNKESLGCFLGYDEEIYVCLGREERCTGRDSDGAPDTFDSWRNTLPLDDYIKCNCFIDRYSGDEYDTSIVELHSYYENRMRVKDYEVIGHPITRGRLCYLKSINNVDVINNDKRKLLMMYFNDNPELYNQTILEWDEKTLLLVRDFLLSIQ